MSEQPMSDRIADLREWVGSLPNYRDTAGAVRVLDEIAASHAGLPAALENLLLVVEPEDVPTNRASQGEILCWFAQARKAVAAARGA